MFRVSSMTTEFKIFKVVIQYMYRNTSFNNIGEINNIGNY